jgi:hypothetical protein
MQAGSFILAAALALAGCGAGAQEQELLPADAAVLPGSAVGQMLHQCSRSAPAPGETTWQPSANDIASLEVALPAALAASDLARIEARLRADPNLGSPNAGDPAWATAPQGWHRQYVGLVRGGRRFVYGNFFPRDDARPYDWRAQPVLICDGGPVFFGVEYDVEARRFTHIAFNGSLG